MIEKLTGFIVSSVAYKDTSLILNIFTKEHGIIGVMARGAKSMKSRLRATTQNYTYGFFYVYYKEEKISLLKDVDIIDPFFHIHNDITLIGYLTYISELATQVYKESKSNTVFSLMIEVLKKINEGYDPQVLTNIFEIKCLPYLGVGILLDECAKCGNKKDIVTIDGDVGGFICKNCYQNERVVSIKTIQLLRMYFYIEIKSITKLEIKEEIKKEIDTFLTIYYNRYTGMYLKSKNFLEKVKNSLK